MIEFDLGTTAYHLTLDEVGLVADMLYTRQHKRGESLRESIREAAGPDHPRAIRLGLDDIAVLRAVLCRDEDVSGFPGLAGLKLALCAEQSQAAL